MQDELKEFSREELATFNGENGQPVYIAHDDKVYDVSESKLWKTGNHMRRHQAGTDLTEEIGGAPHGIEVFEKFPQVGILKPEKDPMDEHIPDLLLAVFRKIPMLRRHPHPMTVHFPIAFMMLFPVLNILYLVTGNEEPGDKRISCPGGRSGGHTGSHCLLGHTTGGSITLASGRKIIAIKIFGSLILITLILVIFMWRLLVT